MSALFESVLIANRGEIAVRLMRTLRTLGIRSIAIYTDPDRDALHVVAADDAMAIGPASAYLDVERVVEAAAAAGATALHPGYGFLSRIRTGPACAAAGVTFVRPPPAAIEAMGDKIRAKRMVAAAGVPAVPGTERPGLSDDELVEAAVGMGLPVRPPAAGGGGAACAAGLSPGSPRSTGRRLGARRSGRSVTARC